MKHKFTVGLLLTTILILASIGIANAQTESAIILSDGATVAESENVTVADNIITVTEAGSYTLSGSLTDGQVVVAVDSGMVNLNMAGVEISNSSDPALLIESADEVVINLPDGVDNTLISTAGNNDTDDATNAALYSAVIL